MSSQLSNTFLATGKQIIHEMSDRYHRTFKTLTGLVRDRIVLYGPHLDSDTRQGLEELSRGHSAQRLLLCIGAIREPIEVVSEFAPCVLVQRIYQEKNTAVLRCSPFSS
jgi:NAD-dependent SIR2 family protein deacetylase